LALLKVGKCLARGLLCFSNEAVSFPFGFRNDFVAFPFAVGNVFVVQTLGHGQDTSCRFCGVIVRSGSWSCSGLGWLWFRFCSGWSFGFSCWFRFNNRHVCRRCGGFFFATICWNRGRDWCFFTGLSFKLGHLTP